MADLLLLRANPLVNITNSKQIAGVVLKGQWFDNSTLKKLLHELPTSYTENERAVEEQFAKDPSTAVTYLRQIDPFFELGTAVMKKMALNDGVKKLEEIIGISVASDSETPIAEPEFINDVAGFLFEKQKTDDAIGLYQFNISLHPKSAIAYDRLARAYIRLSKYDLALQLYRKALEVDPGYWNADIAKRSVDTLLETRGQMPG